MGNVESQPPPPPPPPLEDTLTWPQELALRDAKNTIPVTGMPTMISESCVGDGFMSFSIRGTDGPLFYAYLAAFNRTWGRHVRWNSEGPSALANGTWVAVGETSPMIWEAWVGPSEMSQAMKVPYFTHK
jgi:hypothetical protein